MEGGHVSVLSRTSSSLVNAMPISSASLPDKSAVEGDMSAKRDCREVRAGVGNWAGVRARGLAKVMGDEVGSLKDIREGSQSSNESSRDTGKKSCSLGGTRDPRLDVEPAARDATEAVVSALYTVDLSTGSGGFGACASDVSRPLGSSRIERCLLGEGRINGQVKAILRGVDGVSSVYPSTGEGVGGPGEGREKIRWNGEDLPFPGESFSNSEKRVLWARSDMLAE